MRNAPVSEPRGLFVGLATLDVIHRIAEPPAANQKITAAAQFVADGGPAANAAVTFAALGGDAVLVTALGTDPVADLVRSELVAHRVEVIDAAKVPYGRAMKQEAINDVLVEKAKEGKFVVRLKGGDPFVFARGQEEVIACADAGVPVTVVPGVTSAIAVPALAGVPVTHRAMTHEFVVVSGHLAPDHPESLVNWDALAALRGTIVLLMAVERIELFAKVLLDGGRPADTPVLVVQHGTTSAQRSLRTTLAEAPERIRSEVIRPPAIIVIGAVAAFAA